MVEEKLREMGISVPEAPVPLAAYIPALVDGNLVYTAGQLPLSAGQLQYKGKLGREFDDEEGKKAAQLCALNCLSVIKAQIGTLDRIERIIKVTVFVNSADGFSAQPKVANGASEFFVSVFGEAGKHVRSAVGVNELPLNAAVEVEIIAKLKA